MARVRPMLPGIPVMVLTISERRGITTARVVVVPAKRPKTATRLMAFPIQPSTLLPNSGRQVSEIFVCVFPHVQHKSEDHRQGDVEAQGIGPQWNKG